MSIEHDDHVTRRQAIAVGLAGAASIAALSCAEESGAEAKPGGVRAEPSRGRMPVAFLPHGGGPWPFVDLGMSKAEIDDLTGYLRSLPSSTTAKPEALLVVSAHWEERAPTIMTSPAPGMYYDYYGFPPASYELRWPAKGHAGVAARTKALLDAAGFEAQQDDKRGFDHGTFIPLMVAWPGADVPTVQLSLKAGLDPKEHLAIGRALAPLRDEGVFILGSGMTYHNMRGFRDPKQRPISEIFDAWLRETVASEPEERDRRLADWASAPAARAAHPREEHLLPLMVVAGAAGTDRGKTVYNGSTWGIRLSAHHFG